MKQLRAFFLRLLGMFGLGRRDREMREELETHRRLLADEYRSAGMADAAARRAAAAAFGSVDAAVGAYRDRRGLPTIEGWVRDSVFAARSLRRSPLLASSIVLVLGLGVGFSAALAAVLHAVAWQGLPVPDADRVVKFSVALEGKVERRVMGGLSGFSFPEFTALSASSRTVPVIGAVRDERLVWQSNDGPVRVNAALVTAGYVEALRLTPARGRWFAPADAHQPVAVVSDHFWRESLGATPSVIGASLVLDRVTYTVVGVAGETFTGTTVNRVDLWLPLESATALGSHPELLRQENVSWLQLVGRLDDRVSLVAANAEVATIAGRLDAAFPGRHSTIGVMRASRLDAALQQPGSRGTLWGAGAAAAGAIAILLLICGSNAAALLLARGATRHREIALRMALGAGRGGILRAIVAEMLLFGVASAVVGVAVAAGTLRVLSALLPPVQSLMPSTAVDWPLLTFSLVFAFSVAAFFGLAPVRQALRVDCLSGIQGRGVTGSPAMRLRRALVSVQVAVSLVLLVVSALFARSFARSLSFDPGYPTAGLYVVEYGIESAPGSTTAARPQLLRTLKDRLASQGGMIAGLAMTAPFYGRGESAARLPNRPQVMRVGFNRTDAGLFRVLGLAPTSGRLFADDEADVVVVNAALARALGEKESDALGRRLSIPRPGFPGSAGTHDVTVVGVVPTVQMSDVGAPDLPTYYEPIGASAAEARFIVVRARDDAAVARTVTALARATDPTAFVRTVSVRERIGAAMTPVKVAASAAGLVGLMALLVAAVGIHGMVSHLVTARTREIGVRLALGAEAGGLIRLLVRSTLRGVLVGALVAGAGMLIVALSASRAIRTTLVGVAPLDPLAWISAAAVLAAIAVLAAYLPARRALRTSPLDALRHDA